MPLFAGKEIKMDQQQNMELTKDQIIQELIALLNQNQQREAANNVFEMAALIDGMEKRLESVTEELVTVKDQLRKMEEREAEKGLQQSLKRAVNKLEQDCKAMKKKLFEVKTEIKAKAGEIVTAAKQKGKAALNKVAEFLGVKKKLENIRQNVQESIADVDKSIGKIDAFGTGMREAGQKIANTFRTFADKPEKEYGEKKFSKTDKAERETAGIANVEAVNPVELANVAEPEFQYGAEAFEAHQQETAKAMTADKATKNVPVKNGKSR